MAWTKILFKGGGILTQVADALINPEEAGYGSDIVRAVDEDVGGAAFLRKLQIPFTRQSSASMSEDVAVCSWHLAKNTSDNPDSNWLTADYVAAEARFTTWWTAVSAFYGGSTSSLTKLKEYRWYKHGPAFPVSGPPVRITTKNSAASSGTASYPPQVSMNISEHTAIRKHWGRFYLPAPITSTGDGFGRITSANLGTILTATVTLYNGLRTDGMIPVVYSAAKPVRPKKGGGTLPAQPARAYAVESLKMDDVFDVIRSRRFDTPINATLTTLT